MATFEKRAAAALRFAHANRNVLRSMKCSKETRRLRLALSLLTASADYGLSSAQLLVFSRPELAAGAAALQRPQLETLLRGTFFASEDACSDGEIDAFVDKEVLPIRDRANGGRGPVTVRQMARFATELFREVPYLPDVARFERMVENVIDDWHGLVHGGTVIMDVYRDRNGLIEFSPSENAMNHLMRNSATMCGIAWVVSAMRIAVEPKPAIEGELASALSEFTAAFEIQSGVAIPQSLAGC